MKYYLIEITTYNDGTNDEVGLYTYTDLNSAVSVYHTKMGGMMKKSNVASEQLMIINSENGTYAKYADKYVAETTTTSDETTTTSDETTTE